MNINQLFEIHCHTAEVSACSKIDAKRLVQYYKKIGFTGIVITDHFIGSGVTIPKDLSYKEQIKLFCKGYELAKEEGDNIGLKVFFGWEIGFSGTDFLTFGLDKEWLLKHPEIKDMKYKNKINEYLDLIHKEGGFIIHAHPFREAKHVPFIRLIPRKVDAVEIINMGRTSFENDRALEYANIYNLIKVGGSDNHVGIKKHLCGLQMVKSIDTIFNLINSIKKGQFRIFKLDGIINE